METKKREISQKRIKKNKGRRSHTQGKKLVHLRPLKTDERQNTLGKLERHNLVLIEELVKASSVIATWNINIMRQVGSR